MDDGLGDICSNRGVVDSRLRTHWYNQHVPHQHSVSTKTSVHSESFLFISFMSGRVAGGRVRQQSGLRSWMLSDHPD